MAVQQTIWRAATLAVVCIMMTHSCHQVLGFVPSQHGGGSPVRTRSSSSSSSSSSRSLPVSFTRHYSAAAASSMDGNNNNNNNNVMKTISKEGTGAALKRGDIATVKYSCYLPDSGTPFARSESQRMTVGSGDMIEGWEEAIQTMRIGERALIRLASTKAYGSTGVPPVVPPNASIEIDLEILDAKARSTIDFDTLAIGDPTTPRTAESIAAAYDSLMEKKALEVKKEGLEGWIETVKGWYFFGFFEGETGEEAPWYLKPSITFPLAFAIVGAAFWVSFQLGAISERGVQSTDELDEIILSSLTTNPAAALTTLMTTAMSSAVVISDSIGSAM